MRGLSLPGIVLGIVLAIVFFEIYGSVTRPAVPKPISGFVEQFAPGVQIGAHVADARYSVAGMSYVPRLGYVGLQKTTSAIIGGEIVRFSQVRLLLDQHDRAQVQPNPAKARIDAVELVSADPYTSRTLTQTFLAVFRKPPRTGCVRTDDGQHLRPATVWTTPNERGGLALVTDIPPGRDSATAPTMTSVIAFTGKFQGASTLRAHYYDFPCTDVGDQPAPGTAAVALAAAASDSVTFALSDSLGPSLGFVASQAGSPAEPLDACRDQVDSHGWESAVSTIVELQLPPGYQSNGQMAEKARWSGPAGSIEAFAHRGTTHSGWTGLVTSECDMYISGAPAHIDLMTTTYGRGVHAVLQPQDAPAIAIEAMGKTIGVQAQLLHAIRYAHISAAWGRPQ